MRIFFKNRRFEITLSSIEFQQEIQLPVGITNKETNINDIYVFSNGVYVSAKSYNLKDKEVYFKGEFVNEQIVKKTSCKEDFLILNDFYYDIGGDLTNKLIIPKILVANAFDVKKKGFWLDQIPEPFSNIIEPTGNINATLGEKWELFYNTTNSQYFLSGYNVNT